MAATSPCRLANQGAFVVNAGAGRLSDKVIAAIRTLTPRPIQFIVNTSFHSDFTGDNVRLRFAGRHPSVIGSFFSNRAVHPDVTIAFPPHPQ